jgi:hypothetical protein
MAATRCGHTNMYNYFGVRAYSGTGFTWKNWKEHHNSIVVLRNPLDRVVSALPWLNLPAADTNFFVTHSAPYMNNMLIGCNFRIIDFYDLEQYIPRQGLQSYRTNSNVGECTAEEVHVENSIYTLRELEREVDLYHDFMANKERISIVEWRELTR